MTKVHENDDLWYAIENNGLSNFKEDDIIDIVAEVPGENDEFSWWWVLELQNGKFALLEGWCDYTGWDCQSGLSENGIFDNAILAAENSPEEDSGRKIKENLIGQINGIYPKYTLWN